MNEEYEEEMFEEMLEPEEVERLKVPKLVSKYMRRALEISNYNPIPAESMHSYFLDRRSRIT